MSGLPDRLGQLQDVQTSLWEYRSDSNGIDVCFHFENGGFAIKVRCGPHGNEVLDVIHELERCANLLRERYRFPRMSK